MKDVWSRRIFFFNAGLPEQTSHENGYSTIISGVLPSHGDRTFLSVSTLPLGTS